MKRSFETARRCAAAIAFTAALWATATPALASKSSSDDDEVLPDARLMGYETKVNLDGGSMMTYSLLAFLGVLAVGVTFKSAGRSHLD